MKTEVEINFFIHPDILSLGYNDMTVEYVGNQEMGGGGGGVVGGGGDGLLSSNFSSRARDRRRESSPCEFLPWAEKILGPCEMARTGSKKWRGPTAGLHTAVPRPRREPFRAA